MTAKTTMSDCRYSPQISPGNPNITPPAATVPTLVMRPQVTFTFPYVSPTLTVNLDAPVFNNRDTIQLSRIIRETRGKTLKTFRNSIWPKVERLSFSFDHLSKTDVTSMKAFIIASVGKDIGYLDFESRQWKGFIVNPESAITKEGRGPQNTLAIIFEGILT